MSMTAEKKRFLIEHLGAAEADRIERELAADEGGREESPPGQRLRQRPQERSRPWLTTSTAIATGCYLSCCGRGLWLLPGSIPKRSRRRGASPRRKSLTISHWPSPKDTAPTS